MVFFKSCFRARTSADRSQDAGWRLFSLKELQNASNNFNYDNKLGEGRFGSVYWGQLWDGSQIAVKRLKLWSSKREIDFAVEVEILGRVRHKNLLSLRGYCAEGKERLLVYNYMPNLSLSAHLHGHLAAESNLDWERRMNIAIGSAEALAYLHHHATPHIIHGDLKSSNVLLNAEFEAQVADFGFAELVPETSTVNAGAMGYFPPDHATPGDGKLSEKSDVYSFGVLLLELVSGRKPVEKQGFSASAKSVNSKSSSGDKTNSGSSGDKITSSDSIDVKSSGSVKQSIVEWATPMIYEGRLDDIADPKLSGNFNEVELKQVVQVAQWCSQTSPENRPSMIKVVELLKKVRDEKIKADDHDG
ncbi:PTI1-like tyrosine-protein kinase At3g15890 [Selaginella moellendorffii]|uniref:PTI1-like tyrosine-protein kinase At3g15890 n=1 Tax=Selaginella moellendorffii TaxID=88036 RepID=UPI000D1C59ED|nr:PTI1-like tyrosine-protein kinase At3g15890 [Selaginella moellendorffii]XP_024530452.1 PTI1-like tyrosine-protein kinase At3g15890 [Selaginella moellendorffii]|eukprot:XP_024530451.1 PTI1-like tyrosine-protein kinase At3g15890 [Selaginella moellendorffii]